MIRTIQHFFINRYIDAFERGFDYDMSYSRAILSASTRGFRRFAALFDLAKHREGVPVEVWYAAKWVAVQSEDCGPCQQLLVTMATREGVSPKVIRALWQNDAQALGPELTLVVRWARAFTSPDPAHHATLDDDREALRQRYGDAGLTSLALAMAATRSFPFVKRALGYGHTCQRVQLDGQWLERTTATPLAAQAARA